MLSYHDIILTEKFCENHMHFHIPSYFDKTQTRHVGLLAIARWTGLVLCRNALWDSFEDARTIYVSYYKVAQEAGSKFVPQTFR